METGWHRMQMDLLIESLLYYWRERNDFFVGGNMFLYYSTEQAQSVIENRPSTEDPTSSWSKVSREVNRATSGQYGTRADAIPI